MSQSRELHPAINYGVVPLLQLILAFAVAGLLIVMIGQNPVQAVQLYITDVLLSPVGIGQSIYYASTLMFTGMAVALASSYAHFLIVGSPANALTFALGVYPDTNRRALEAIDFVKYGFGFFILSMLLLWIIGFLVIYPIVGFPEGILEQATQVLKSSAVK